MTLSRIQRIRLIENISEKMSLLDWPKIDYYLNEFRFTTSDTWQGSKNDYVTQMVTNSFDEDLANELLVLLNPDQAVTHQVVSHPRVWKDNFFRLFISHSTVHAAKATQLKLELEKYGITSFVAHVDINPTLAWQQEIELALQTCDALLAYLTEEFYTSLWCPQEVGFALARKITIIPLEEGVLPQGFMQSLQALRMSTRSTEDKAKEIFKTLKRESPQFDFENQIINNLLTSDSYTKTTEILSIIETINPLTHDHLNKIKEAYTSNHQVSGMGNSRTRINRLLQRLGLTQI